MRLAKRLLRSALGRLKRLRSGESSRLPWRETAKRYFLPLLLEPLEKRYVLSGDWLSSNLDAAGGEQFQQQPEDEVVNLTWQGQSIEAFKDQWIIRLANSGGSGAAQTAWAQQKLNSLPRPFEVMQHLGADGLVLVKGPAGASLDEVTQLLAPLHCSLIEPNVAGRINLIPNDPSFNVLWGLNNTGQIVQGVTGTLDADIDAPELWDVNTGSSAVIIGIVDSGVNYNHPDLAANIFVNPGEIAGNGIDDDGNGFIDDFHGWDFHGNGSSPGTEDNDPMDQYGHGTHVAGTIGAVGNNAVGVAGVAHNVKLLPLKIGGTSNSVSVAAAVSALNYVNMMKDRGFNIRATNHSWGGGGFNSALSAAIDGNRSRGILLVASAGNGGGDGIGDNNDAAPQYPASYTQDNVISVAATNSLDGKGGFSNYGLTSVDLGAPGVSIFSTMLTSGPLSNATGYGYLQGTSMATPHVTGAAALLISASPTSTYSQIRTALLSGVDPNNALRTNGPSPVASGGRLNVFKSLQLLGLNVTTTAPAVNSMVTGMPADYVVNFSSNVLASSVEAADFLLDGIPANTFVINPPSRVTFHYNNILPFSTQGLHTMSLGAGSILRSGDNSPLAAFSGQFRFDAVPLQVVSTNPAVGSVVTASGSLTYDVHFNEAVDPTSLQAADLTLSGIGGATVSGAISTLNGGLTARFTINGLSSEGVLSVTIGSGAVTDIFGNPNPAAFTGNYTIDIGAAAFPTPLAAKLPLGSLIYEGQTSAIISASDADSFTLPLDAGQTISLLVTPTTAALQPVVELRDAANSLMGTATAITAGGTAVVQPTAIQTPGTYTVIVYGLGVTTGPFNLQVTLNAALEIESAGGLPNDAIGFAQQIDSGTVPLAPGSSRIAVRGSLGAGLGFEDFESGVLPSTITTYSSNSFGRIRVTAPGASGNSSAFALLMDSNSDANYALNEAIYTVNLSGVAEPRLSFSHVQFSDEPEDLPDEFFGHFDGDGVSISDDGVRWYSILSAPSNAIWATATIDLADAAAAAGMTLGANFKIKFQQYDNFTNPTDGRAYDDIRISVPDPQDYYAFTLPGGQSATLALAAVTGEVPSLELLDANGTLLAGGVGSAANVSAMISNFMVPTPGTYFARISGASDVSYNLVITKSAGFDTEPNDAIASAQPLLSQPISGEQSLLGHLGQFSASTTLRFNEVPFQPVDGLGVGGVLFGFTVGGIPSTDANYNSGGPGQMKYVQDPSLEGSTQGILTLNFDNPTSVIQFGIALSTGGSVASAVVVQLFDALNNPIVTIPVNTQMEGFGFTEAQFNYTGASASRAVLDFKETAATRFVLDNLVFGGAGGEIDYFPIHLSPFATLQARTATPAGGPGQFVNGLDPLLRLYQANGALIASDDNSADGRNALLSFFNSGPAATFYLAVSSTSATASGGEYVLRVSGNTLTLPPFLVTTTDPPNGAGLLISPLEYHVHFNDSYLAASIQPSDLVVDGSIVPTGVSLIDGDTVSFFLPPVGTGTHTVSIAPGAIQDVQGTPITSFSANFTVDAIAPRVIATSLAPGAVVLPGSLSYQITFDEPMSASNLSSDDFRLLGNFRNLTYFADTFTFNAAATVLTLNYSNLPDDNYSLTLFSAAGRFTDTVGNGLDGEFSGTFPSGNGLAGGDFTISFGVDALDAPFPTPLTPKLPLGSLIYQGAASGTVAPVSDSDNFTLALDAGQTVTLVVSSQSAGLQPTITLRNPGGAIIASATAPTAGQNVVVQPVPVSMPGIHTITVSGAGTTTGAYSVQLLLNAAQEEEGTLGGATNNNVASAQDIATSFAAPNPSQSLLQRGAVVGVTEGSTGYVATAVPFNFTDISNTGTELIDLRGVDDSFTSVNLPFAFSFFGTAYTSLFVSSNGLITFGNGNSDYFNASLDSNPFEAAIAPFWDDLVIFNDLDTARVLTRTSGVAPNRQFIVQWDKVSFYSGSLSDTVTFQAVLNESTSGIQFNYQDLTSNGAPGNNGASASAGIKAVNPTNGRFVELLNENGPNNFVGTGKSTLISAATGGADYFKFTLAAGELASLAVTGQSSGNLNLELRDGSDAILTVGVGGATNLTKVISSFAPLVSGTYYARVSGAGNVPYSLVVTKSVALDSEANDSFGTAAPFGNHGAVLGAIESAAAAPSSSTVVPSQNAASNGNSNNFFPFGIGVVGMPSMRYQQIYSRSEFAQAGSISAIRFRRFESEPTFVVPGIDIKVNIGYAATSYASPSTTFANNVGAGTTTAFDGILTLSSTGLGSPQPFDIVISFSTPFFYDPSVGDLLLDLFVRNSPACPSFDFADDQVPSATRRIFAYDVNLPTGLVDSSVAGLITRFDMGSQVAGQDWYTINIASTASALFLQTSTPADGPGEFGNSFNPRLELYSPSNVLVASGNTLADGRNEILQYVPAVTGIYRVRVSAQGNTTGEYFLTKTLGPLVSNLSIAAASAVKAEGHSGITPFTFTVTRTGDTSVATSVNYAVTGSGPSPANGDDFGGALPSGVVTFAIGDTNKIVTINVSGDTLVEPDEGFTVTLSNASGGAIIGVASALGTILNDDSTLAIAAASANKAEGNSGTTAFTYSVVRTGDTSVSASVGYAVIGSGGSPASGGDFGGGLPTGTATFAIGDSLAVITIFVSGDTVVELDEGFTVTLVNPSIGSTIGTATASGTILNDDASLSIETTDASKAEGNSGTTLYSFTVTRTGYTGAAMAVNYTASGSGGSPANAVDFGGILPAGVVNFAVGDVSKALTVNVSGDLELEPDEGFTVTISGATGGATIATATAQSTIFNDDLSLAIAAASATKVEGNAGNTGFTFTVTRAGDSSVATSADFTVTGSGANPANATDFGGALPSGVVTFAAGDLSKVITVNVSGDTLVESDEGFTVTLSNATSGATIVTPAALGNILNDDSSLSIAATDASKAEGNSLTTTFTFLVTRVGDTSAAVDVNYAVTGSGIAPANGGDFGGALPGGSLHLAIGESAKPLTINVSGDTLVEADEGFTVTLSGATGGATIAAATAEGAILNDDTASVSFAQAASNAGEDTGGHTIIVTLNVAAGGTIQDAAAFTVSAANLGNTSAADFVLNTSTIVFPAGSANGATQTVTITPISDTLVEGTQQIKLSLTVANGLATVGAQPEHIINLLDADSATITFQTAVNTVAESGGSQAITLVLTTAAGNALEAPALFSIGAANGSADSSDYDQAAFPKTVTFAAGQGNNATQTIAIVPVSDAFIEGSETLTLTANATSGAATVGVPGTSTITIVDASALSLTIGAASISENGGATTATVTRLTADLSQPLVVTLATSDPSEATVPVTVTILANQASATFNITAVDDTLLDGPQTVNISAAAGGFLTANQSLEVADSEILTVSLGAASISEKGGTATGTVTRGNSDTGQPLVVTLASSDTTEVTVPLTVTILANQAAATFSVTAIDDSLLDGTQTATVSASALGYIGGGRSIEVTDHEPPIVSGAGFVLAENSAGGTTVGTVTVTHAGTVLSWSITAGNASGAFAIDATGKLTVVNSAALNFEVNPAFTLTVQATDNDVPAVSSSAAVTVNLTNVNEPPTTITLSSNSVAENASGAAIGNVTVSDPDAGDTFTLSVSDSRFEIAGGQLKLKAGQSLDFEATPSLPLAITANDSGGLSKTQTVTLTVTNVNEAPTALALSANSVVENIVGAVIGNVSVSDPDAGDTFSFAPGDTRFEVVGGQLRLKSGRSLDFEAEQQVTFPIAVTDAGGLTPIFTLTVVVTNGNEAPTNIGLSSNTVAENAAGATIGNVTVADPDAGDTFSLAVLDARFEVIGGQLKLKTGQSLDFEAASSLPLTIIATDAGGLFKSQSFTVSVTNVNDAPTSVGLSSAVVAENAAGAAIGTATVSDQDAGDTHTLTVSDTRFEFSGAQLKLKAGQSLDFEVASSIPLTITATDAGGLAKTQSLSVIVTNVNEAPSAVALSAAAVAENAVAAPIGNLTITDPDAGDTHITATSDNRFEVVAGQLRLKAGQSLDFETAASFPLVLTATDAGGLSNSQTVTISVTNVNEAPSLLALSASTVAENQTAATVGGVTALDPDAGDTLTLAVSDSRFEVAGGQLKLKAGQSLDFETIPAVPVSITATDSGGLTKAQTFTVTVTNVNEAPTAISLANSSVAENAAAAGVGSLTVLDPDAGDTHALGVTDPRFEIVSGNLKLKAGESLDFESAATLPLTITATDAGGLAATQTVTINVTNVNEAPSTISFSATAVVENAPGASAGNVTAIDPDSGDTLTFSINDNRFEIAAGQLKLKAGLSLDFEAAPSLPLTITATDGGGLVKSQGVTVTVTNINEAPTLVNLSATNVAENAAGAVIGNVTVADPDIGDAHTLSTDEPRFEIVSGQLKLKSGQSLDFEAASAIPLAVVAIDVGGLSKTQTLTIAVTNVNEAPAASSQSGQTPEDVSLPVALAGADVEGDTLTYVIPNPPLHGTLSGAAPNLTYVPSANYSGPDSFTFRVNDGALDSPVATVTIGITPVNDPPTFTAGQNLSVPDSGGPQSISAWSTNITAGAPDESSQTLHFTIDGISNPNVFVAPPSISSSGQLTFTPKPNTRGTATVTISLHDNGTGNNASLVASFTIDVTKDHPWFNSIKSLDVNNSGTIEPFDALLVINYLNAGFPAAVAPTAAIGGGGNAFLDPSKNNEVAPFDALLVINFLNANAAGEGEGATSLSAAPLSMVPPGEAELADIIELLAMDIAQTSPKRKRL